MIRYPSYIETAISRLEAAGFEAFVVGGALRDALLGRTPYDWDVTTSATPDDLLAIFGDLEYYTTGLKHGTLSVIIEHTAVEITTFRVDGDYTDARHPSNVTFTPRLEEDLARRDFTVNALAYSHTRGLIDLYGGRRDLEDGIIRAVGDPETRFREDALRILRGFRFASKLGFTIEENTLYGMQTCRALLIKIAAERVTTELRGILVGKNAYESLALMQRTGVLETVAAPLAGGLDASLSRLPADFCVRAAYLLRTQADENVNALLRTLRLSNAEAAQIRKYLALLPSVEGVQSDYEVRRLMSRTGESLPDLLAIAEASGQDVSKVRQKADRFRARGDCVTLAALAVDGCDIVRLGFQGHEVGEVLSALFDAVLHDPALCKRESLLALAKKNLDKRRI